jgi:uncharacterized protein YifE (UPF0438 family)
MWKRYVDNKEFPTNRSLRIDFGIKDQMELHSKCPQIPNQE